MKHILVAITIFLSSVLPSAAQEVRNPDIEATIQSQIDAFLQDDFTTAFTYASPNIKRLFGSPERFGQMVRNGYPMVWRPSDVDFLELRRQGPLLFQKVLLRDANGAPHVLEYNMIETDAGWQIDGVILLAAPPIGA
ncbi:DUF4864 domain-containing protein [Litoreibacter roseus]|uniref:DUF4864 domain-containing protein n=1 Tax=Litoreibacter roseus TaxID=2601869 RepID=A0A6N6JC99_9RHOB|nr:DUF4864 domain-containing protein [Litoreibacter roseus]GFE63029.1 DUF4864 domain-containing protein [Litoreibacter roseus]